MKTTKLIIVLSLIAELCQAQTPCSSSDFAGILQLIIQQDDKKPESVSILAPLTLSLNNTSDSNSAVEAFHIFSYNSGFTFRFYVLSSNSWANNATLKFYRRYEDESKQKVLLFSVTDKSGDSLATIHDYKNQDEADFYLELSLEEGSSGCAVAMVLVSKTK